MAITPEEVAKVTQLSRLALSPGEVQTYSQQLSQILDYVEKLKGVDVSKVEPMISAAATGNVFRPDTIASSLARDDAFLSAPNHDGEFFRVPPIID